MNFYKLSKNFDYKYIDYSDSTDWKSIKCSKHEGHQRAGNRVGNLQVKINGDINREFFWTFLSELVVTENFVNLLNQQGFKGFDTKLASIINKSTDTQFFEFIATGQGGLAVNIKLVETCEFCGLTKYKEVNQPDNIFLPRKVIINPQQWDGSDIFTVKGLERVILITEPVKELIVDNQLMGSIITKAENFEETIYKL